MNTGKFSIATAIPYVNANPHIGFAMELIQADVLARYERLRGREVFFLTGTDENALKNVQAAEKAHIPVKEFIDEHVKIFANLSKVLNISNDDFIRTTEERHIKGTQELWKACGAAGDIYKKKYRGLYCVGCEEFKTEKDLVGGLCPEHHVKPEEVEEENYFFRLSKYQDKIEKLIESDELRVVPETRKNEALSFVRQGLHDFSISRSRERAKNWGISAPGDESQIIYVWYDALTWFINSLGYSTDEKRFTSWWNNGRTLDLIGKGINRFHTIYWPAMLISAGVKPPTEVYIHGYVTTEGEKMSKSLGNVVDPFRLVQKYGADVLRFYLLRGIPSDGDGDFSIAKLEALYNADLANGLGNFSARVLALADDNGGLEIGEGTGQVLDPDIEAAIEKTRNTVYKKIEEFKLHEALAELWSLIAVGDNYVNRETPWKLEGKAKDKALFNLVVLLDNISAMLLPFLPETSQKITQSIEWRGNVLKINRGEVLFPRLR